MRTFEPPKSPTELPPRAKAFFEDAQVQQTLGMLWGRWQDEKQYEDINDYKTPFLEAASDYGVTIVKMNKRPFGFNFTADGQTFQLTCTSKQSGLRRA